MGIKYTSIKESFSFNRIHLPSMKALDALQLVSLELIFEMRGEYDTSFL